MKLQTIRLSNFQSFGVQPTELGLDDITYLIGPTAQVRQLRSKRFAACLLSIHPCAASCDQTFTSPSMRRSCRKSASSG